ncbi:hypothetical protein ACROYT_G041103 [Oculina patagonica]
MENLPRQSETKISYDRETEAPLNQSQPEGQQTCSGLVFKFSPDDSASIIAEANLDAQTSTLNIIFKKWNTVLVGNSNAGQVDCNCHFDNKQSPQQKRSFDKEIQSDSGPKEEYCEQQKTITKDEEYQLQPFLNEANRLCKEAPPDEIVVDVEPQLPLIKIQGYLNGSHCEQIAEQLEGLQDDGQFDKHDRLVTS